MKEPGVNCEQRLRELGFSLPQAMAPSYHYDAVVRRGEQVFVSGQLPWQDGAIAVTGLLGADLTTEQGVAAAQLCALNGLAQLKHALGRIDGAVELAAVTVYVASAPTYCDQPRVADGASELLTRALGEAGRHSRVAVGVASLPRHAAVEIALTGVVLAPDVTEERRQHD
jgi:enamine deaminase RidA (YjgF/YER057c/UK114 family)